MKKFIVTCTMIHNGSMEVIAENQEEALDIAQNKLNENVDCIDWDFGEASADYTDEEVILDGDGEEESRLDPDYKPKYHVGEYIIEANYKDISDKRIVFFRIDDIRNGKYICSDGKEDDLDYLDTDVDLRLATVKEIDDYFKAHHKYNVGDFIVSECGTIYKVISAEHGSYIAENKYGDERCYFDNDDGVFNFRLATPDEVNVYKNQTHPRYKVGDIVKSDNSPADKIVSVNSETYFFESGEQSDITALDDDANFYLVQPPKYKVGDYGDGVPIAIFDDDENHHTETFHREDFQPFDKVLVRDDNRCVWVCAFFSHIAYSSEVKPYVTCGGEVWEQCVPYNNETVLYLGTKQDYNGKYKTW